MNYLTAEAEESDDGQRTGHLHFDDVDPHAIAIGEHRRGGCHALRKSAGDRTVDAGSCPVGRLRGHHIGALSDEVCVGAVTGTLLRARRQRVADVERKTELQNRDEKWQQNQQYKYKLDDRRTFVTSYLLL